MLDRYSQLVIRYRWPIVFLWIVLGIALPFVAPSWNSVTHDGDFAYLPANSPTVVGQELLDTAFAVKPPKSQIVVGIVRADDALEKDDFVAGFDVARRLINVFAAKVMHDLESGHLTEAEANPTVGAGGSRTARALDLLDQSIDMSNELATLLAAAPEGAVAPSAIVTPLAESYFLRAALLRRLARSDDDQDQSVSDFEQASRLQPELKELRVEQFIKRLEVEQFPISDLWTWRNEIVGERLQDPEKHCRLIVLHFPTEFMAAGNIPIMERVEREMAVARDLAGKLRQGDEENAAKLIISGSAAVGADMLRSSARNIRNTDWLAATLVLLILAIVYRSPMMVAVPMASIYLALQVSTSLIAILAQAAAEPNWEYWDFKVFTTTRIFIVVLLYGAGTDACLFLISRFREECGKGSDTLIAVRKSLSGVGAALVGSAATTILGLAMLLFAQFGKYHYSGPAIAFCLFIVNAACLSLAPALLAVLGPLVFWPWPPLQQRRVELAVAARRKRARLFGLQFSEWVVRRPALVIGVCFAMMAGPALQGWVATERVTYDVLNSLGRDLPSRRGTETLQSLFEPGEAGPIVLLVSKPGFNPDLPDSREAIADFHKTVFTNQVASVRGSFDPLGETTLDNSDSLTNTKALKARVARASKVTRDVFIGEDSNHATVLKWEVVQRQTPFSVEGQATLVQVEQRALHFLARPDTPLYRARLDVGGVSAALRDLEVVTQRDYRTVRWLVTTSVLVSLIAALRRPVVSVYIVATVLLGFFVTMGLTYWTFAIASLNTGYLLDWRVPLFLFVILVAVGADYSVYLASRVFEEQAEHGPFTGLRRAIEKTGGVISSCGVIMAGTFISMTSSVWASAFPESWDWPREWFGSPQDAQRGIVELGFALAIGILLDTFVVRTVLLPAFLASLAHWKAGRELKRQKREMV